MSSLEEVLVPMYLLHRYQVEAVSKIIGGLTYEYNLRGKSQGSPNPVPADIQMNALNALLRTLHAESLMLPESILKQIPPRAFGYPRNRETFQSKIGPAFDHFAIAETASDIVLRLLFDVGRANRLVAYHSRNSSQPHLKTMIDLIFSSIWKNPSTHLAIRAVQKVTESQMLKHLMALAKNPNAYSHVQAVCYYQLENIKHYANAQKESKTTQDQLYYQYIVREIDRFMKEPEKFVIPTYTKAPDGSPIGSCDFDKRLIR